MPNALQAHAVRLEFGPDSLAHDNLSGVAFTGDWMWVVGDESAGIERLRRLDRIGRETLRYGDARSFALADLLDLPGAADDEADLEGLQVQAGWLWLVGSHGLKRKSAKPDKDDEGNARRLARLSLDANRRLLARIPIDVGADGEPLLVREAADGRRAARLKGDDRRNELTRLLEDDAHLGPFLTIPGKDNGFDIEGMAVDGERVLLGLRGPVLRGWAMLLELRLQASGGRLHLAPLDADGTRLRKHFLPLGGMGVRDLHLAGDDLFVLAGPTMVLDGDVRLFHWPGGRRAIADNRQAVRFQQALVPLLELPHTPGCDRAEAFCEVPAGLVRNPSWVVLYDAPGERRRGGDRVVFGDLLRRE